MLHVDTLAQQLESDYVDYNWERGMAKYWRRKKMCGVRCHGVAIDVRSQSPSTSLWVLFNLEDYAVSNKRNKQRSSGFHVNLMASSGPFSSELSKQFAPLHKSSLWKGLWDGTCEIGNPTTESGREKSRTWPPMELKWWQCSVGTGGKTISYFRYHILSTKTDRFRNSQERERNEQD